MNLLEVSVWEREKRERDAKAIIEQQLIDAKIKSKAEGLAEGEAKVLTTKQVMARKLLGKGLSPEEAASLTKLSLAEVELLSGR